MSRRDEDTGGATTDAAATGSAAAPTTGKESCRAGGIVLAAGGGSRFGHPKALVRLDGQLLVERAARVLTDAGCDPVVAVLGAAADDVVAQADLPRTETVRNAAWRDGMGSSLRAGLASLAGRCDAAVVLLADQPGISVRAVRRLVDRWREDRPDAVAATFDGVQRNPALLDARVWDDVAERSTGDVGARAWLRTHPDRVVHVACDDVASPVDVDVPSDLTALS